jgi:Penicillin-insensitive murein endopeptidase
VTRLVVVLVLIAAGLAVATAVRWQGSGDSASEQALPSRRQHVDSRPANAAPARVRRRFPSRPETATQPPRPQAAPQAIRWRRSRSLGLPYGGRLVRGVKLPPEGRHFFTWDPIRERSPNRWWRRFGSDRLLRRLLDVLADYATAHPKAPRVGIGDLSRPHGGSFGTRYGWPGHVSHQNGLDADVYYPRRDRRELPVRSPLQIDWRLAQDLLDRFVQAGAELVFIGPNTRLRSPASVVQVLPRYHDNHMHVRLPAESAVGANSDRWPHVTLDRRARSGSQIASLGMPRSRLLPAPAGASRRTRDDAPIGRRRVRFRVLTRTRLRPNLVTKVTWRGLGAALATALLLPASATAKQLTAMLAVGADGNSVNVGGGFSLLGEVRPASVRLTAAPGGEYMLLYPLMEGGLPMQPGRYYPAAKVSCWSWTLAAAGCVHTGALSARWQATTSLPLFARGPTTLRSLAHGRARYTLPSNAATAIELALLRAPLAKPAPRRACRWHVQARWQGPAAAERPRALCLRAGGVSAGRRLFPLSPFVVRSLRTVG